jgi:hypothetical protein
MKNKIKYQPNISQLAKNIAKYFAGLKNITIIAVQNSGMRAFFYSLKQIRVGSGTHKVNNLRFMLLNPNKKQIISNMAFIAVFVIAYKFMRSVFSINAIKSGFRKLNNKTLHSIKIFNRAFFKAFKVLFKCRLDNNLVTHLNFLQKRFNIFNLFTIAIKSFFNCINGCFIRSFHNPYLIVFFRVRFNKCNKIFSRFTSFVYFNNIGSHKLIILSKVKQINNIIQPNLSQLAKNIAKYFAGLKNITIIAVRQLSICRENLQRQTVLNIRRSFSQFLLPCNWWLSQTEGATLFHFSNKFLSMRQPIKNICTQGNNSTLQATLNSTKTAHTKLLRHGISEQNSGIHAFFYSLKQIRVGSGTHKVNNIRFMLLNPNKQQIISNMALIAVFVIAYKFMRSVFSINAIKTGFRKLNNKTLHSIKIFNRAFLKAFKVIFKCRLDNNLVTHLNFLQNKLPDIL